MHFEDVSHGTEDFSEKKQRSNLQSHLENKQSHFNSNNISERNERRSPNSSKKYPIQIIKYNIKRNIFEFNDEAEEVLYILSLYLEKTIFLGLRKIP